MKIQVSGLLLILGFMGLVSSIYLPLTPLRPRCMMVYTIGDVESVKIFLDLPRLPDQTPDQKYTFSMRNTESQKVQLQNITQGTFNRQYDLVPNVIYEICITLISDRTLQDTIIYYKAETVYNIDHSQLKVPDNLLKKEDFKEAYEAAYHIQSTVKQYKIMQGQRDITSNNHFSETSSVDKNLVTISIVQIAIVVAAGVYQFISLKNYLISKQYI